MKNLRYIRKEKGLSMKALGNIIGVAESTISLYETGKRQPDVIISIIRYIHKLRDTRKLAKDKQWV